MLVMLPVEANLYLFLKVTPDGCLVTQILKQFIIEGKELGISNLLANISSLNEGSINFHKKHGFRECGRFKNIGRKFEKDFDVIWMQLYLNE